MMIQQHIKQSHCRCKLVVEEMILNNKEDKHLGVKRVRDSRKSYSALHKHNMVDHYIKDQFTRIQI